MAGDYTRYTFDPVKGFSGVHKQQGRVSLDSSANEFEEILDRRDRAEMFDTVGAAVYPVPIPPAPAAGGFSIGVAGGKLTIGQGRMYVDGILVECFGDMTDPAKADFDWRMNDLVGQAPLVYDLQPFFYTSPSAKVPFPMPSAVATNRVYLDVWQREVTVFEEYGLRRIVNASGTETPKGGSPVCPEVIEAVGAATTTALGATRWT